MDLKKEAVAGAKWTSFGSFLAFIIGIIQLAIIARYMTQFEVGIMSLLAVIVAISGVLADGGISIGIIHFQNTEKRTINSLYWMNIGLAILVAATLFFFAPTITTFYSDDIQDSDRFCGYIRLISVTLILRSIGQQFFVQMKRDLKFNFVAMMEVIQRFSVFIVLVSMLIFFNAGVEAYVYGVIFGAAVFGLVYLITGLRDYFVPNILKASFNDCGKYFKFGSFHVADRSVANFTNGLDKLLIGKFFGKEILGFYEMAYALIDRPIKIINPIFTQISFPLYAKIQEDTSRVNDWFIKKIEVLSLIIAPIYFGMWALREELVSLIQGPGWALTATSLTILFILGFFNSLNNPLPGYAVALGKPNYNLYFNLYRLVAHIGILSYAVFNYDYLTAISIYVIGSILFTLPVEYWFRYRLSGMSIVRHMQKVFKHILIAGVMAMIVYAMRDIINNLDTTLLIRFLVLVFFGGLVYFILNWIFNRPLLMELLGFLRSSKS